MYYSLSDVRYPFSLSCIVLCVCQGVRRVVSCTIFTPLCPADFFADFLDGIMSPGNIKICAKYDASRFIRYGIIAKQ